MGPRSLLCEDSLDHFVRHSKKIKKEKMINALIVCKHPKESKEANACKLINKKGLKAFYAWKNTFAEKELNNIDLVIAIGGDGTILSASHYLKDKPMLAVNISPETSEGALATIPLADLDKKLNEIVNKKYSIQKLERIEVLINKTPIPFLSLNEVFIANEKPYLISKYELHLKNLKETQKSSGLLFATGTGSTAWFKSAGGAPFSPESKYIKMITREPYFRKLSNPSLLKETINENERITIVPLTPSILAIDSIREYKLSPLDNVAIRISNHPLIRII
jgi:NAD kinase